MIGSDEDQSRSVGGLSVAVKMTVPALADVENCTVAVASLVVPAMEGDTMCWQRWHKYRGDQV